MQKITPMLWFDNQAEEAANFYVSVFKNSKVTQITHYAGEDIPEKRGQVMAVSFELNGQEFTALNGGPDFKFTEAVSFVINCDTQEEIDYYWDKLTAGGGKEMVFPVILGSGKKLFGGMDEKKSMKLISSQTVGDGVGILIYEPKQA
jgi:predicted 3-demethylubiquinone-9 3-methyltransferase (glyoxalase superfamily)